MTFPMTLDRFHRRLTVATLVITIGGLLAILLAADGAGTRGRDVPSWLLAVAPLLLGAILGLAWAMAPRAIELCGRELRILRRAWPPLVVPLDEIAGIEGGPPVGRGTLRLAGSSGFFGSYGLFWTSGFGRYRLYATRIGGSLTIRRRDHLPIVVTPDEPDRFREAVAIWQSEPENLGV